MTDLQKIEHFLSVNNYGNAIASCSNVMLKQILASLYNYTSSDKTIIVKLLCNWTSSENLCKLWNKMSKGDYTWNNIKITWDDNIEPNYYVVINATSEKIIKEKTIVFRMEPNMEKRPDVWKEWTNPDKKEFMKIFHHSTDHNNIEYHLDTTYSEFRFLDIKKTMDIEVSTVLSSNYSDMGHIKRIDFVKYLDTKQDISVHVYGNNKWNYKNYKGELPPHNKNDGLYPYKYTFNAENNKIDNYFTEKIVDAILAECLIFYWGPYNISKYIDPDAYIQLDLSNFETDYKKMLTCIQNNEWEKRLPSIKKAKEKILNEQQFFPRIEKLINDSLRGNIV